MYSGMALKEIAVLEGVRDLPAAVKGQFAYALKFEATGDSAKAQEHLEKAVAAELKLRG